MSAENWMPRPWNAGLMGCIWLPRMLDKGRQVLASKRQGQNLMNSYLFGDFDYADGKLLKFLRTNDGYILDLLREMDDDEAVAKTVISESGRSSDDIQAWGKRFRTINAPFIAMWNADEGRREPGCRNVVVETLLQRPDDASRLFGILDCREAAATQTRLNIQPVRRTPHTK